MSDDDTTDLSIANAEQARGLALIVAAYYGALVMANVPDEYAANLTYLYQQWLFTPTPAGA